jgi:hypothetical protein
MVRMEPDPTPQAPPGWYPDFWTPSRKRYWTGTAWTFATTDSAAVNDPAPEDPQPLPAGHGLPAPVVARPAATAATSAAPAENKKQRPILWVGAVVVGLLVGVIGIALSSRSSTTSNAGPEPTLAPGASSPSTTAPLSAGNDPSALALGSLVVKPEDVPATADVVLFPGGAGLSQPTLDLCNGVYPSESKRTARLQDAVLDAQGRVTLSTEAVLYADSGGTTQGFAELQSVVAACPRTPLGQPPAITTFNPPPDGNWPQVPTVNRRAYDFTTDDGAGGRSRTIAVYLQRGRVLVGVYFAQPDAPQVPVEGKTSIPDIVAVFAARVAALPTSVVGA